MPLSVLLLLLLMVCSTQANFYGAVMNYYPRGADSNRSTTGILHYKLNARPCLYSISNGLSDEVLVLSKVDEESSGEWCQTEGPFSQYFSTNARFQITFSGGNWIAGLKNGIIAFKARTVVELRIRSDTGKANTSPQTTIIPAVRVPSNCQRNFSLLMFDPDGDEVKCRYGNTSLSECNPCTLPSVLSLSSSCTLSFSPTSSSDEGPYAVQLVMEDFPRQTINLTETSTTQTTIKTTDDAISIIPVQFVIRVDPAVPSCTEGLFLPKFLPPTPTQGAQLHTNVSQTLEINISAEALNSTISELLFSGPHSITENETGPGEFTLTWTPSESEAGQSHPICFVIQAVSNETKYHSELRCVIVTVGNESLITATPETAAPTSTPMATPETIPTSPPTTTPETTTPTSPATTTPETTTPTSPATTAPETTTPTSPPTTAPETTTPTSPATTAPETTTPTSPATTTPETTTPTSPATTAPETTTPTSPATTAPETTTPTSPATTAPETTTPTSPATTAPETTTPTSPATTTPETTTPTSPATTAPETTTPTSPATTAPETTTPTSPATTAPETTTPTSPATTTPEITTPTSLPTTTSETTSTSLPTSTSETTSISTPTTTPEIATTPTSPATTTPETTTSTSIPAPATTLPIATRSPTSGPVYVVSLRMKISSLVDLSQIDTHTFLNQIKRLLLSHGLPSDMSLRLSSSDPQTAATAAPTTVTT